MESKKHKLSLGPLSYTNINWTKVIQELQSVKMAAALSLKLKVPNHQFNHNIKVTCTDHTSRWS